MRYFDFHTHILLKQLFDEHPNIDARVSRNDVKGIPRDCTVLPLIIESQIHQSQLAELSDEVIAGATLYGCESFLALVVIPLQNNLQAAAKHKMSLTKLNDIAGEHYHTFDKFTKALTFDTLVNATLSFNVLTKDSFDTALPKNKVNIFFLIEGCHSLMNTMNRVDAQHRYDTDEILTNLDILLKTAPVIGINITHLQQSSLCNHAFAMQIADATHFIPVEDGFTSDGRKVVQDLFDRGICVDMKHMSYKSRLEFRSDIDAGNYANPQPPLCSHVGFTGIPFSDWKGHIQNPLLIKDALYIELVKPLQTSNAYFNPGIPAFNLCTINLFDEEIAWIVNKGGMIGLSLDRRILGYVSRFDNAPTGRDEASLLYVDKDYISKREWASLGFNGATTGGLIDEDNCVTQEAEDACISKSSINEYYLDHILMHLQHYFQACFNAGIAIATAQKHIAIGSDFDGFINPFINLPTVEGIPELKQYIHTNLAFCLASSEDSKRWSDQLNINVFIEDLFYNNGFNFIKSRFIRT